MIDKFYSALAFLGWILANIFIEDVQVRQAALLSAIFTIIFAIYLRMRGTDAI